MTATHTEIWLIILLIGAGTFLIRFSFLGLIGARQLPEWALRHLRYTTVAILPGLVAPQVLWPSATGGDTDPARLLAAIATLGFGLWTRNVFGGMIGGAVTLYLALYLIG